MNRQTILIFRLAAVSGALGVALGAFGAHGLRNVLDEYSSDIWNKAVFYQLVHTLGALLIAGCSLAGLLKQRRANTAAALMLIGICLFSGSLYLLALTGQRWLGMITPVGGVAFIVGWLLLTLAVTRPTEQ